MFYRKIVISPDDYIEFSSRLHNGQDSVLCSIVTSGSSKDELLSVGLILSEEQLETLAVYARDAKNRRKMDINKILEE